MKQEKRTLIGSLIWIATFNAGAIQNGESINEATYEKINYFVNIINSNDEKCGAQVIGGNWLLTSRHCTTAWDRDENGDTSDDIAESGTEITITAYQGLGGYSGYSNQTSRIVYSGNAYLYTFGTQSDAADSLEDQADNSNLKRDVIDIQYTYDESGKTSNTNETAILASYDGSGGADIALIKLEDDIQHYTSLLIGKSHNLDDLDSQVPDDVEDIDSLNYVSPIYEGLTFDYFGWGNDENGDAPTLMQTGSESISVPSFYLSCSYTYITEDEEGNKDTVSGLDCSEQSTLTDIKNLSYASPVSVMNNAGVFVTTGNTANSGDSGTAAVVDGVAYGLTKGITSTTTVFTSLTPYTDWITSTISDLNVTTKVELKAGDSVGFISMPVQNLSSEDIALSVTALSGNIFVDDSNCSTTLAPLDSCYIDITIYDAEDQENFSVQWDDSHSTEFTYVDEYSGLYHDGSVYEDGVLVSAAADSEDDTTDDTTETDTDDSEDVTSSSSGSSGGSLGLFGLLGMIGLAFSRRKCKAGK